MVIIIFISEVVILRNFSIVYNNQTSIKDRINTGNKNKKVFHLEIKENFNSKFFQKEFFKNISNYREINMNRKLEKLKFLRKLFFQ